MVECFLKIRPRAFVLLDFLGVEGTEFSLVVGAQKGSIDFSLCKILAEIMNLFV